jgi:FAD/FMN-containing dehydrogenase
MSPGGVNDPRGGFGTRLGCTATGSTGRVALPGSASYDQARPPFIAWFEDLRPRAVVSCVGAGDVAQALAFARCHGIEFAVRSGGHCFGGLALGGGHGVLGRLYGLTLDHLVSAQVVLADGRVADCDEHHESDLFWALRGAGAGNFGVVTSLAFRVVPAPASMANFHVTWSHRQAVAVIAAWQQWAPNGPEELSADLELTAAGDIAIAPHGRGAWCCARQPA